MIHIASSKTQSCLTQYEDEDIQPNAVDLRMDRVFKIMPDVFRLEKTSDGSEKKTHRSTTEIMPTGNGVWTLERGAYEVLMAGEVSMAAAEAGFVITRSTLNRNGITLSSGLYDSGYCGLMAALMRIDIGKAIFYKGCRVGQFVLFESEMIKVYSGDYGSGSETDKKRYKL